MLDRRNHFEISSVVVELYAKMYEKMPKILRNEKRHKLETKNIWFKIWQGYLPPKAGDTL